MKFSLCLLNRDMTHVSRGTCQHLYGWSEGYLNINLTPEVGVTPDGGVGGVNLDTRAISALQVGVVVVGMNVTLANQANSPNNEQ